MAATGRASSFFFSYQAPKTGENTEREEQQMSDSVTGFPSLSSVFPGQYIPSSIAWTVKCKWQLAKIQRGLRNWPLTLGNAINTCARAAIHDAANLLKTFLVKESETGEYMASKIKLRPSCQLWLLRADSAANKQKGPSLSVGIPLRCLVHLVKLMRSDLVTFFERQVTKSNKWSIFSGAVISRAWCTLQQRRTTKRFPWRLLAQGLLRWCYAFEDCTLSCTPLFFEHGTTIPFPCLQFCSFFFCSKREKGSEFRAGKWRDQTKCFCEVKSPKTPAFVFILFRL